MSNVFDERCVNDPQGVIKDLVGQTTRQAKTIHLANLKLVEQCKKLIDVIDKLAGQQTMADDWWVPIVAGVKRAVGIPDTIERDEKGEPKPPPKRKRSTKKQQQTFFTEGDDNNGNVY